MAVATTEQIETRVVEILREFVEDPGVEIERETTLESIDIDSLDLAELAQVIEEEYQVTLKGDDVKDFRTVGDAVDVIAVRTQ